MIRKVTVAFLSSISDVIKNEEMIKRYKQEIGELYFKINCHVVYNKSRNNVQLQQDTDRMKQLVFFIERHEDMKRHFMETNDLK